MARGKSISVYLIDGIANGKIKAQISNWNGIAYKIPRELLTECKDFEAFGQSGVYFLFGYRSVYVGQAEVRKNGKGIHQRILDHESDRLKDCWDEVVIFTTKDNSLGRTDISYLENRFYNKAKDAGRYSLQNGNEPTIGTVTEEKQDELEEFMDLAELVLGALGYKVFEKERQVYSAPVTAPQEQPVLPPSQVRQPPQPRLVVPELPDKELKIGAYVRTAMRNLSASGYVFDKKIIEEMCTPEWSVAVFHTQKPFMKVFVDGVTDNKGPEGKYVRFWSEVFAFGDCHVYVSKEWYDNQRKFFDAWYKSL